MKSAIVTGATGFIGSYLVEYLSDHGIQVVALGRKHLCEVSVTRQKKLSGSRYIQLDMSSISLLPELLLANEIVLKKDCVFMHLAWGGKNKLSDLNIKEQLDNVHYACEALKASKTLGCIKFMNIGTMEEAFTSKYLSLDHNKNTEYNRHVIYSVAKIAAKNTLKVLAGQLSIDFIHVLHSHVMGPDDEKDSFLQVTLKKLLLGEDLIFSSGEQTFDVISVVDCCRGYSLIANAGKAGCEYWVGSGSPRPLREYVEIMSELVPSTKQLQFGRMPYNDIKLNPDDFSIKLLSEHTGYMPAMTYREIVVELRDHFLTLNINA